MTGKDWIKLAKDFAQFEMFCTGHQIGARYILRFLSFFGGCAIGEGLVVVGSLFVSLSPASINAFGDQVTIIFAIFMAMVMLPMPVVFGLVMAHNPPDGKDSYCHMLMRGFRWGLWGMLILLGVRGIWQ